MDKLNQRNPELYETNICIAYIEEAETQDHLATCTIYQNIWSRLESEISEELYRKTEKSDSQIALTQEEIKERVFGKSKSEREEARKELIRGLLTKKRKQNLEDLCQDRAKKKKIANTFLGSFKDKFRKRI